MWSHCHVERVNGSWAIYWPDNTIAWNQKYKTKGWATRTLNWLINKETKCRPAT